MYCKLSMKFGKLPRKVVNVGKLVHVQIKFAIMKILLCIVKMKLVYIKRLTVA